MGLALWLRSHVIIVRASSTEFSPLDIWFFLEKRLVGYQSDFFLAP